MAKTTPQKYLPDYFCATFALDRGTVYCYWKGGDNCTWLFFYLEDAEDPEIPEDEYRDLVSLEFDNVVRDHKEAEALAEKTWAKHKEQILSTSVGRLYVVGEELLECSWQEGGAMKTGIAKPPRRPEQQRTDYRPGVFLCPRCGTTMTVVVPAFEFDVIAAEIELFFRCRNFDNCNCCISVKSKSVSIEEHDCPGTEHADEESDKLEERWFEENK